MVIACAVWRSIEQELQGGIAMLFSEMDQHATIHDQLKEGGDRPS